MSALGRTGRVGVRIGAFGRIVLQVEVRVIGPFYGRLPAPPPPGQPDLRLQSLVWRDAAQNDLASIRPLLVRTTTTPELTRENRIAAHHGEPTADGEPSIGEALRRWHVREGVDINHELFVFSVDLAFESEFRRRTAAQDQKA